MNVSPSKAKAAQPSKTPDQIHCVDPATRAPLGSVRVDSPADVDAAVARARPRRRAGARRRSPSVAACSSALLAYTRRSQRRHLRRSAARLRQDARERADRRDLARLREAALDHRATARSTSSPRRSRRACSCTRRARIEYHPLGVVAAIIPWNYPLQNIMNPAIPALMAGNAIVMQAVGVGGVVERALLSALREASRTRATIRDLIAGGATASARPGAALARSAVDMILFIGSVGNGRRVVEARAERVTPAMMELGGKDAVHRLRRRRPRAGARTPR